MRCSFCECPAVSVLRESDETGGSRALYCCEFCTDHDAPGTEYLTGDLTRPNPGPDPSHEAMRLFEPAPAQMPGQTSFSLDVAHRVQ